ncbi:MAG: hypothetical protein ACPH5N_01010, partial [Pseudomonadales bacterium]
YIASPALQKWKLNWLQRVEQETGSEQALAIMAQHNPIFIPRNHLLDAALKAAYQDDLTQINDLLEVISEPFTYRPEWQHLALAPKPEEKIVSTFCGT